MSAFSSRKIKIMLIMIGIVWGALFSSVSAGEINSGQLPVINTVDTLLHENFSGTTGPFATYPVPGWTVIDSGVPEWDETSWARYTNTAYPTYWNGDLARVFFSGTNAIGDWLISPMFDCSGESTVNFSYKQSHSNRSTSDNDTIFVYGSTDGGGTWSNTIFMSDTTIGALNHPDTETVDISSWAAGNDSIRIAFYFKGYDVLTWYVDEPFVGGNVTDTLLYEDFNGVWGPYGNNPPTGWTIINEVSPDPPNANDWSRWYYSTWPDTVARAYSNVNNQTADEWFITPSISFSPAAICSLTFYNSYWDNSSDLSDSALVLGSTDGGINWDHTIVIYTDVDDRSTNKGNSWRGFDISSWAQNQSDVKLAFHYLKDIPTSIGWWFVDDVTVTETTVGTDNVATLSIDSPSDYMVVGQNYTPTVTLQNLSTNSQTVDLNLIVKDAGDTEVYNYTEMGILLNSLEIASVDLSLPFSPASAGNHTFDAVVINPGDEDPSDDSAQVVVPAYQHEATGGPDAFGYRYIDSTDPSGPTFNWIEISGTGTQIEPTLHYFMSDEIPLGFSMDLYGNTYSSMWVNSHGEINLNGSTWLSSNDCPLPDTTAPHEAFLAVFWDLLYIHHEAGLGVYYQYFDNGDNDYMVVEWQAKVSSSSADTVIFEAILYQDGEVVYQYNYVNDGPGGQGQGATVGMEYDPIPSGLTYYCDDNNPANRLQDGLAIRWYYEPPSGCDYAVGDVNGSDSYNGLDITYGVAYFKGGPDPICPDCPVGDCNGFAYCGDVNNSCSYNGLDITYGVAYFKGGPGPLYCVDCPPAP